MWLPADGHFKSKNEVHAVGEITGWNLGLILILSMHAPVAQLD